MAAGLEVSSFPIYAMHTLRNQVLETYERGATTMGARLRVLTAD